MKRVVILVMALFMIVAVHAQKKNVQSAFSFLRKGKLDKALSYMKPALENTSSNRLAKTWKYAGDIYLQIMLSDNPKYQELDDQAALHAYEAYLKCLSLDEKNDYKVDIYNNVSVISQNLYNSGVAEYNEKEFLKAADNFVLAAQVKTTLNVVDTSALINAGLCALQAEDNARAIEIYLDMMEKEIKTAQVYLNISDAYKKSGDTVNCEKYINEGMISFPGNVTLITNQVNLDLVRENWEAVLVNIDKAIALYPENGGFYYVKGSTLQNLERFDEAKEMYFKTLEFASDPKSIVDANYNLGALYIENARIIQQEADKIPLNETEKYNAKIAESDVNLKEALPFLEKAHELDPEDTYVVQALKSVYSNLKMLDKAKALDK